MTPRRLAVKALIHQEQAGYSNLVLDAELKKRNCTIRGALLLTVDAAGKIYLVRKEDVR